METCRVFSLVLTYNPPVYDLVWRERSRDELEQLAREGIQIAFQDMQLTPPKIRVVEYVNTVLNHYFLTVEGAESAAIDQGQAGPGWVRTGYAFRAWQPISFTPLKTQVCRFYGSVSPGPNSHFYTADAEECALLNHLARKTPADEPRWNFEGFAFRVDVPSSTGVCPEGDLPVWRAYNNGVLRGMDSNHRYSLNRELLESMARDDGWSVEGISFCVLP